MYRSHRLVRQADKIRLARAPLAKDPIAFDEKRQAGTLLSIVRSCEEDGMLAPGLLDGFEDHMVAAALDFIDRYDAIRGTAEHVAATILDGKQYKRSLNRQLCTGCSAVAHAAVEERVYSAMREVMRVLAQRNHRDPKVVPRRGTRDVAEEPEAVECTAEANEMGAEDTREGGSELKGA